jgi:TusA-related sulfurtransferase
MLMPVACLDFRQTKCPLNFVKTRLALEKIQHGDVLEVWIARHSESVMNIPNSLEQEGHHVVRQQEHPEDQSAWVIWVERR